MAQFLDARKTEVPDTLMADVCIVGAGAAGLTLALQLASSGIDVLLLESGGEAIDAETQGLYAGEQGGVDYFDLSSCRLRFLGGTTNHWAGYCRENDPIDYAGRPELGLSGWPLGYQDMRPYVERAAKSLGLDMAGFEPKVVAGQTEYGAGVLIERQSETLQTKIFQIAKQLRFRERYAADIRRAPNLKPVLFANVTHIQLDEGGRTVKGLAVRTLNQRRIQVRARTYVLCAHAIENARLLLSSNDVQRAGVGNDTGHVGRHFMEHPVVESGLMFPSARFSRLYDYGATRRLGINVNVSITERAMREHGMLSYYCRFSPVVAADETLAAIDTLGAGFWRPADLAAIQALGRVLADIPGVIRYVEDRKLGTGLIPARAYRLQHRTEQSPNGLSRVTLSAQRDRLGSPGAKLEWRLSELDYKTMTTGQTLVAKEFTRLGLGSFRLAEMTPALIDASVQGHNHHAGTTKMADAARDGVVDRHCKVHGTDNLYVAGSSVFPTIGYAGPTMMLMALALRLGDHLTQARRAA